MKYLLTYEKFESEEKSIFIDKLDENYLTDYEKEKIIFNHIKTTNPHTGNRNPYEGIENYEEEVLSFYDWNVIPIEIYPNDIKIDKENLYPASKSDVELYMKYFKSGKDFPIIVLVDTGKKYLPLDGAHRLQAAINLEVPIKAYIGTLKTNKKDN